MTQPRYPYTLDQYAALLAMVCDSPADDGPRVVLADWLEEHGEPARAEFIRVGVELVAKESKLLPLVVGMETEFRGTIEPHESVSFSLASLQPLPKFKTAIVRTTAEQSRYAPDGARIDVKQLSGSGPASTNMIWIRGRVQDLNIPLSFRRVDGVEITLAVEEFHAGGTFPDRAEVEALRKRERELFDAAAVDGGFVQRWVKQSPCLTAPESWRRGFVDSVTIPAADWLAHGDDILASQPVQAVALTTWPNTARLHQLAMAGKKTKEADAILRGWNATEGHSAYERYSRRLVELVWPRVKRWAMPAPPHQPMCVTCRQPARWYTQEWFDTTTIRDGASRVDGLRSGYCDGCRPAGAMRIPGFEPARYATESNGVRVEWEAVASGLGGDDVELAAVSRVVNSRNEIVVVRVGETVWGMATPAMGTPAVLPIDGRLILLPGQSLTITTMANALLLRLDWPAPGLAPSATGRIQQIGGRWNFRPEAIDATTIDPTRYREHMAGIRDENITFEGQYADADFTPIGLPESPRQRINRPVDLLPGGADVRSMADMTFVHPLDSDEGNR